MTEMIVIREGTIQEIFDRSDFLEQAHAYCEESGTKAFGPECPDRAAYEELEKEGGIRVIVATRIGQVIGFAIVLKTYHYHFSLPMATIETLWLDKNWRKSHAGLGLIRYAKMIAKDWGYKHLTASAPAGSRLSQVFGRLATHTDDDFVFEL